ncbi:hypothetical protein NX059_009302 [Plenodomus lindquistii]|nr:hypothetical protein NX059_009302 [Plenodomus lindquistii]
MTKPPRPPTPRPSTPGPGTSPVAMAPPSSTPTTEAAQSVETDYQLTLALYTPSTINPTYQTWYLDPPLDPEIRTRTQDLYKDRTQTNRQQVSLSNARAQLLLHLQTPPSGTLTHTRRDATRLDVYTCVLTLYDERLQYIQDEGQRRLDVWGQLCNAQGEQAQDACKSTLTWMEDDYKLRMRYFIRDVVGYLWEDDQERAEEVLRDSEALYPVVQTRLPDGSYTELI